MSREATVRRRLSPERVQRRSIGGTETVYVDYRSQGGQPWLFAVSVLCDLGSAHGSCQAPDGRMHAVPEGAAHLLEHALTAAHQKAHLAPVWRLGATVRVRTSADRTVWAARAVVDDPDRARTIAETAAHLVAVVAGHLCDEELERALQHEATIINQEWAHWHSRLDYRLRLALTEALYPEHRLGRDPLGPRHSVNRLELDDVIPALNTLRHGVRAVTIVAPIDDALVKSVSTALTPLLEARGTARWRVCVEPVPPRPAGLIAVVDQIAPTVAVALLGLRLSALRDVIKAAPERARQFILGEALASAPPQPLPWQATADSRMFASKLLLRIPWVDSDDALFALGEYRRRLRRRLRSTAGHLENAVAMGLAKSTMSAIGLLRLAHRADLHELAIEDAFAAAGEVSASDIERLVDELSSSEGAVAYSGPELG